MNDGSRHEEILRPTWWSGAILVPTVVFSFVAAPMGGVLFAVVFDDSAGWVAVAATCGLLWAAITWYVRRPVVLVTEGTELIVRFAGVRRSLRRDEARARWHGSGLRLRSGDEWVQVPIRGGRREREAAATALENLSIPWDDPSEQRAGTAIDASLSHVPKSLDMDGMSLVVNPVYQPPRSELFLVFAVAIWILSALLAALGLEIHSDPVLLFAAFCSLGALVVVPYVVWDHVFRTVAVELHLSPHTLTVTRVHRRSRSTTPLHLANVDDLDLKGASLVLTGSGGTTRIRLPDVSSRTREGIADLIRARRQALEGSADEVPRDLARLATEAARQRSGT